MLCVARHNHCQARQCLYSDFKISVRMILEYRCGQQIEFNVAEFSMAVFFLLCVTAKLVASGIRFEFSIHRDNPRRQRMSFNSNDFSGVALQVAFVADVLVPYILFCPQPKLVYSANAATQIASKYTFSPYRFKLWKRRETNWNLNHFHFELAIGFSRIGCSFNKELDKCFCSAFFLSLPLSISWILFAICRKDDDFFSWHISSI